MERENYYVLLELPIEPPAEDPGLIKAAITRKRQEWTRAQDHPSRRTVALAGLDALPDIQRVMLNPSLRAAEARAAQEIRADMLRRCEAELRILEAKGHLLPREIGALASKYKQYGVDKQWIHGLAQRPISEEPPEPARTAGNDEGEVLDRMTARTVGRSLSLLGSPDLYAFLGEKPYASIKKLQAAAEAKRREAAAGAKNARSVAAQELAGLCLRLFENFSEKQKYDRYLKLSAMPAVGEMIDEEFTRMRHIGGEALLRLVNFAVETYGCKVLEAQDYISRYCGAYRIPLGGERPLIRCPHCREMAERDSVVCPSCAAPLRGNCPGCTAPFAEGPAACGECGFVLADMVKALPYLDDAHTAVVEGNWSSAQRALSHAKHYWPGHAQIEPLEKRSKNLEERYARYMDNIADCVRHNRYYAALELIREAQERQVHLPASTVEQVERTVSRLEEDIARLQAAGGEPDIRRVLELTALVADSMELERMLSRYPPAAPDSLQALVRGRQVRLQWPPGESGGRLEYVLVRKRFGTPLTAFDGDILYEGPANSYRDTTAESLCDYYYGVFSKRGGAYSPTGTVTGPVLMVPEIENLQIIPGDTSAHLTWTPNKDIHEVMIWRKLGGERPAAPGDGIRLETERIDGFLDTKIKNDVEYWYYVVAAYMVDGQKVFSRGVCQGVTPHRILAPVEGLTVVRADGGEDEYIVNWHSSQYRNLRLFACAQRPSFRPGEVFPVRQLLDEYRCLDFHARYADSARFRYRFIGGVYLFAAVVFGKFAAVGAPVYLTNVRDVENPACDVIEGDLYLNMKWPGGLSEIALCYRTDRFPASFGEPGSTVQYVGREQYDYDAAAVIRDPLPSDYYISIHSVFTSPDGEQTISGGVQLLVRNAPLQEVTFRFAYKKRLFSKTANMALSLSSPGPVTLPKAVLVGRAGRLPLHKSDGVPLFELDKETRLEGEVVFRYRADSLPPGMYVRLFLHDDEAYQNVRLLSGARLKIT